MLPRNLYDYYYYYYYYLLLIINYCYYYCYIYIIPLNLLQKYPTITGSESDYKCLRIYKFIIFYIKHDLHTHTHTLVTKSIKAYIHAQTNFQRKNIKLPFSYKIHLF